MAVTSMSNPTYTITEAAKLSGLLRYYETIGIIDPIERDSSVYNENDMTLIISVACLSATGMPLEDMRTYLANRVWC